MIDVNYRHFGFLRAKQIFFGDSLPSCEGYDFIYCKNFYIDLPSDDPFTRIDCNTRIIDLTRDSDFLLGRLHPKRRRRIKLGLKTTNYHVKAEKVTPDILAEFQKLYNKFTVPKGAPAFLTWHSLTSLFPYLTAFTSKYDNITYAIELFIHDGQTVRAHKKTRNEHHPYFKECDNLNSLLTWEAIMHFQRLGYQTYDFGGVWLNPLEPLYHASQYKVSFGGETIPTYWYQAKISPLARALGQGKRLLERLVRKFK